MSPRRDYFLESCVTSLTQAFDAQLRGADRVELCIRLETEGMTPDIELTSTLCAQLHIPVRVMIRATEVGFTADSEILEQMVSSIIAFNQLPIEGYVIGLIKNKVVDREAMLTLLEHTHPLRVTFHKAIDQSVDLAGDLKWLAQFPTIDTILTSGGEPKAIDGVPRLLEMKNIFNGDIMAAGKITPDILPKLHEQLHLKWYHGRAIL